MFEWLGQFDKILVTGPHRSGTTVAAKMIAHDTGYDCLVEEVVDGINLSKGYSTWVRRTHFVLQCPGLLRWIHHLSDPTTAVVCMRRPVSEIVASQGRIRWEWAHIVEVEYAFWEQQKQHIHNPIEIAYSDLRRHRLWLDNREGFDARRTA